MTILFELQGAGIGGYETQIALLLRSLRRGHPAVRCLVACRPGRFRDWIAPDAEIVPAPERPFGERLAALSPDLVVTVQGPIFKLAAACRRARVPIVWICGFSPLALAGGATVTRLFPVLFDHVFVPSDFLRRDLAPFAADTVSSLPCAVDFDRFRVDEGGRARARQSLGVGEGEILVGFAARFVAHKRHRDLLRALAALGDRQSLRLLLMGWTSEADDRAFTEVLREARRLRCLERTITLTALPDAVPDYLAALDLFVSPAEHEGLGMAAVEAMALGVPAVVATPGGLGEILDRGNAQAVFPVGDVDALAARIAPLLESAALRARRGREAARLAREHFHPDRLSDHFLRVAGRLSRGAACGDDALPLR